MSKRPKGDPTRQITGWFEDDEHNTYHFESPVKLINRRHYVEFYKGYKNEYLIEMPDGEQIWVHSTRPIEVD